MREVQRHEPPHLAGGVGLAGDGLSQRADELGHLVAEERDQDVVLGLEVEIDGARGDARLAGDVGHARVVVALAGEDPHGGLDDLLRLVWVTHGG